MWEIFVLFWRAGWRTIFVIATFVGILSLPADIRDLSKTYGTSWYTLVPSRDTALITFCTFLVLWIGWIELRVLGYQIWGINRRLQSFERADGWSITFVAGASIQPIFSKLHGDRCYTIRVGEISISNLSKTHSRMLEARLEVKFHGQPGTLVLLPDRESSLSRQNPLELSPMKTVVLPIEFNIEPEDREPFTVGFAYTMDFEDFEFSLFEHFSGLSKTVYIGETYDALKDTRRVRRSSESREERLTRRGIKPENKSTLIETNKL